jgi:hypothetical protein
VKKKVVYSDYRSGYVKVDLWAGLWDHCSVGTTVGMLAETMAEMLESNWVEKLVY